MTWGLILILLGIWLWTCLGPEPAAVLQQRCGLSREGIRGLRLWPFLSHAVIHGNGLHFGVNVLLLLLAGARVEWIAGRMVLLKVLLAGVLAGGLLHLAMSPATLVGLSGGLLALILWFTTVSPESRVVMPFRLSARNLGRGLIAGSFILAVLDPSAAVPGLSAVGGQLEVWGLAGLFKVSHACHLGGALAGWAYGRWVLRPRVSLKQLQRERAKREG